MLPKVVVIGLSPREIKWFWSENLSELYVINCEENETGNLIFTKKKYSQEIIFRGFFFLFGLT